MPPPMTSRSWRVETSSSGVLRIRCESPIVVAMPTPTGATVRHYWDAHIHDLEISGHPPGSPGFFADLDQYHFEKLHHLLRLIDFNAWRGKAVLDVGCG